MALDRWIAVIFLLICLTYGYTAFFAMDASLPPFMRRNPIWPSTFPKILSILGMILALVVIFTSKETEIKEGDIDYRRLHEYKLGQALLLISLMIAYALLLRPAGFIPSTITFLIMGSVLLGERRWIAMILTAGIATGFIWYLVQVVLGIFLSPWPAFL